MSYTKSKESSHMICHTLIIGGKTWNQIHTKLSLKMWNRSKWAIKWFSDLLLAFPAMPWMTIICHGLKSSTDLQCIYLCWNKYIYIWIRVITHAISPAAGTWVHGCTLTTLIYKIGCHGRSTCSSIFSSISPWPSFSRMSLSRKEKHNI